MPWNSPFISFVGFSKIIQNDFIGADRQLFRRNDTGEELDVDGDTSESETLVLHRLQFGGCQACHEQQGLTETQETSAFTLNTRNVST